jgi:hypothetical protein
LYILNYHILLEHSKNKRPPIGVGWNSRILRDELCTTLLQIAVREKNYTVASSFVYGPDEFNLKFSDMQL